MPEADSTDPSPNPRPRPSEMIDDPIAVRAPTEEVVLVQLAARWAETFGGRPAESRHSRLERFRAAHAYLEAVTRGRTPPDLDAPDLDAGGR